MHLVRSRPPLGVVLVFAFLSCKPGDGVAPRPSIPGIQAAVAAAPVVRFSELHYDNTGTDVGEAIEISGPGGSGRAMRRRCAPPSNVSSNR